MIAENNKAEDFLKHAADIKELHELSYKKLEVLSRLHDFYLKTHAVKKAQHYEKYMNTELGYFTLAALENIKI